MRRGDSNRTWRRLRRRHTIAPRWAFRRWRGLEFPGLRPGLRDMTPSGSRCSAMPTGKVTQGGHTARHQRLGVKPSRIFGNSAANRRSGDHSRVTAGAAQPTTLGAAWLVRQAAEAVTSSVCASSLSPGRWNSPNSRSICLAKNIHRCARRTLPGAAIYGDSSRAVSIAIAKKSVLNAQYRL